MGRPNYSQALVFKFEDDFDVAESRRWMRANWHISLYLIGAYMLCIVAGKRYMQSRPRYELRNALVLWNFFLAAFSIIGATRTVPELMYVLRNFGLHHSVCVLGPTFVEDNKVVCLWTFLFTLSKVLELGDTVFIILRKQPLIFLHWYHHATVLFVTWFSYEHYGATGRWFGNMNFSVHALMYSYYACKALRFRIPRVISVSLTVCQLAQMVVASMVNYYAYHMKGSGGDCEVSYVVLNLSTVIYFSYFVLFAHFFQKAYLAPKKGGERGGATSGKRGGATGGERGGATDGEKGGATSGKRGGATSGERGVATDGEKGGATSGVVWLCGGQVKKQQ